MSSLAPLHASFFPADPARTTILDPVNRLEPTIFHEPWWLQAVAGSRYEEFTVSMGGRVVGRMPFRRGTFLGQPTCLMPDLTPFLGPAIDEGNGSPVTRTLRQHEIMRELIAKLQPFINVDQRLHRGITDALPYMQNGFAPEAIFTFEVPPAAVDALWARMQKKKRSLIRQAEVRGDLLDIDPDRFCSLYEANLRRRGVVRNYMFDAQSRRAIAAVIERGRGRIIGIRKPGGGVDAAILYVWDAAVSYYLLTTRSSDSDSGDIARLVWEAMQHTARAGRVFDFGGVGTHGSVLFYATFGGQIRPRYVALKKTKAYRLATYLTERQRRAFGSMRIEVARAARLWERGATAIDQTPCSAEFVTSSGTPVWSSRAKPCDNKDESSVPLERGGQVQASRECGTSPCR